MAEKKQKHNKLKNKKLKKQKIIKLENYKRHFTPLTAALARCNPTPATEVKNRPIEIALGWGD